MRNPLILLPFALAGGLVSAELDDASRQTLLDHLKRSSSEFLESVNGLTEEQWNYKPAPEAWSIAECAEHIALSEDFLRDVVEQKVLTAPPTPERAAQRKALDEKVLAMVTDRSFKAKAPEPLQPVRRFPTPDAALRKFQESREKTVALATSRGDLRERAGASPFSEDMDAYQWLLFLSGHTMRHTAQIREVKANPGFPGNR
ncbi:MAG: DinB family protein [Bryobacteraceae bacterium]|nr:DinB family protein [Bryobacteraceae bacterium]